MTDDIGTDGASSHTRGHMTSRIEVVSRVSGRRRWTVEQKLAILRDAFGAEGSVRDACERHEIGSGQIYTWRRQAMSGELTGIQPRALPVFAEVDLALPVAPQLCPVSRSSGAAPHGQIGIELPSGIRLTVDASVDGEALTRVMAVLSQ